MPCSSTCFLRDAYDWNPAVILWRNPNSPRWRDQQRGHIQILWVNIQLRSQPITNQLLDTWVNLSLDTSISQLWSHHYPLRPREDRSVFNSELMLLCRMPQFGSPIHARTAVAMVISLSANLWFAETLSVPLRRYSILTVPYVYW